MFPFRNHNTLPMRVKYRQKVLQDAVLYFWWKQFLQYFWRECPRFEEGLPVNPNILDKLRFWAYLKSLSRRAFRHRKKLFRSHTLNYLLQIHRFSQEFSALERFFLFLCHLFPKTRLLLY